MIVVRYRSWNCTLWFGRYANGRTAIRLMECPPDPRDGSPIATATVNLPAEPVESGRVIVKDYGENEGMLNALVEAGVVEPIGQAWSLAGAYVCNLLVDPDTGERVHEMSTGGKQS